MQKVDMQMLLPFRNRDGAGKALATALVRYADMRPLILAIPRGGVPIGRIVADALGGDLDLLLVRKLGAPDNPELAIGAIDERGEVVLDEHAVAWTGAGRRYLEREAADQLALIRERRRHYCGDRPGASLAGRTVSVIDDGLATGSTMLSALRAARAQHPSRLVCAVPVAARESLDRVGLVADDVVALALPTSFGSVGQYYRDFSAVDDDAVVDALADSAALPAQKADAARERRAIDVRCGEARLEGDLVVAEEPRAVVQPVSQRMPDGLEFLPV